MANFAGKPPETVGNGAKLAQALCIANVAPDDLARFLGVSLHTVERWLSGKTEPKMTQLAGIAAYCRTPITELYSSAVLEQILRHIALNYPLPTLPEPVPFRRNGLKKRGNK